MPFSVAVLWRHAGCVLQLHGCQKFVLLYGYLNCRLYDCDFNQQLELGLPKASLRTVFDLKSLQELTGQCTWGGWGGCAIN